MSVRDLSSERRAVLLPAEAFAVGWYALRPKDYSVIDGDTIWVTPYPRPEKGTPEARKPSFSVRLRTIAAPEKPRPTPNEKRLIQAGFDVFKDHPGTRAREVFKSYMRDHGALLHLSGHADRYGRMIGDVYAVPFTPGGDYDFNRAVSIEHLLLQDGLVKLFNPAVGLPPVRPNFDVRHSDPTFRTPRRHSGATPGMSFY